MTSSTRSTAVGVPEMVKVAVWSNSDFRCSASTVRNSTPLISPASEPTDQYDRTSGKEFSLARIWMLLWVDSGSGETLRLALHQDSPPGAGPGALPRRRGTCVQVTFKTFRHLKSS